MFKRITLALACIAGLFFSISSYADIYGIVVGDTVSPTGSAAAHDMRRVERQLGVIGRHIAQAVHVMTLRDDLVNVGVVRTAVENLSIGPDDIAIFYYLGHGYRTSEKSTTWLFLYLCTDNQGLDFSFIIESIIAKKPRMALIVADCCNNLADDDSIYPWEATPMARYADVQGGYRALFLQFRGVVVCCGAKEGDFAWCNTNGHCYTEALLAAMNDAVAKRAPTWEKLLQFANSRVAHIQSPYFEVLTYP